MEYGLRHVVIMCTDGKELAVLILVVMEYGLGLIMRKDDVENELRS